MEPSTLTVGDNVEALSRMDDGSVHLTVTSPPYSDLRDYHGCEWDFDALCVEMMRVLVDGGVVAWVTGDRYVNGGRTLIPERQAIRCLRQRLDCA